MKRFSYKQKITALAILFVLLLSQSALLTPQPVQAQWSVLNPDLIAQNIQANLANSINANIKKAWVASIASMLVNVMMTTVSYGSYQAAMIVATGGPAETPLFTNLSANEYMQYVGANVIFETYKNIESADDVMTLFGVRVPDDAEFLAIVREGLSDSATREVGEFDFREVLGNWDSYLVSVYDSDDSPEVRTEKILQTLAMSFEQNEYRSGLTIYSDTILNAQNQANLAGEEQIANAGFLDKVDPITGEVLVPAEEIQKQFEDALAAVQNLPTQIGLSALGDENVLLQLGVYAGSIFTQTLGSELMQKILSEGIGGTVDFDLYDVGSTGISSRERAAEQYKSLLSFRPVQITDYNLLSRLASCPAQYLRNSPQLYSCAIDTSTAAAVARADSGTPMTLAEAIDGGYIDRNWPLIPSSDTARNQDQNCYTYGFCYSNLVKLRKARIIPVGWEMAANAAENNASSPITLGEVMDAFNDCDENGERSSVYPWCHLIDPNWVLKYPQAQCRTLGYGQLLTASGATDRAEECVDIMSCIAENDDGTCAGGYGYCVREKNVWQFRGDECPSEYASCLSFTNSAGEPVDYLTNTIDYGACDENSVGCLWYATQKVSSPTGGFAWPSINNVEVADASADAYKNRIYLNDNREECNSDDGGCSELLVRSEGLSLNLVQNSSFEADADGNGFPDAWMAGVYSTNNVSSTDARSGGVAVTPSGTSIFQFGVMLDARQLYTFSFYAKQRASSSGASVTSYVVLRDENGSEGADLTGVSIVGNCAAVNYDNLPGADAVSLKATPTGTDYERFACTFTTPILADATAQLSAEIIFENSLLWIDDVALEQNEEASIYHTDYNKTFSSIGNIVVKVAPDYLGCTGASTDAAECAGYAQICTENDRGCSAYTPVNGDPTVTGIVSDADICPSTCVGYDTYKQEPTLYEPDGAFPLYFIAESGDECNEDAVGCDEFTNLSTESQEYFTYLRACLTEDQASRNTQGDNAAVFYTWEGSDTEGFQLKTWQLLASDLGDAPCTNWEATASGISCDDANGEYAVGNPDSCDEHSDIFVNPDCREFYDGEGDIFYRPWKETVTVGDSCATYRKTDLVGATAADRASNCTNSGGYFDTVSSECRYFGLSSESESCSESDNGCRKYTGGTSRNSRVAFEDVFESGNLSKWDTHNAADTTLSNDSIATGGHSLSSDGQTVWTYTFDNGLPCESASGCSSTTGNLGGSCTVLNGQLYCGTLSSQLYAGKTYTLSFWAKGSGSINVGFDTEANPGNIDLDVAFTPSAIQLTGEWKRYSVGPLDMSQAQYSNFGAGTVLAFAPLTSNTIFNLDNIVLREGESDITLIKNSWVTPAQCDINLQGQSSPQFHLGCEEYADQNGNTAYLKSVSRLCSEDMVGCTAYYATAESESANAQILNASCENIDANNDGSPDVASAKTTCYLETNTQGTAFNSGSAKLCDILAGESSCLFDLNYYLPETLFKDARFDHLVYGPETAYVEADRAVYLVVGEADFCEDQSAGCQEVGAAKLSADQSVVDSWESAWFMNDPDTYDQVLCSGDQLYCDAFDAGEEGTWYFKNPTARTCEYRSDVYIGGQSYDGWFRTGTSEFCYGSGTCSNTGATCSIDSQCRVGADQTATCEIDVGTYVVGGAVSGIWRNGDQAYDGWVGTCGAEFNGCSEFRDVLDYDEDMMYGQTDGESYYFVDNDNLDDNTLLTSQKCNGLVSQELGCVLFHDTGEAGLDYNASASYVASAHADKLFGEEIFSLVKPISCDRGAEVSTITAIDGTNVDLCANRCAYPKVDMLTATEYTASTIATAADEYLYSGSCYTNSDCATYDGALGEPVEGECVSVASSKVGLEPVPVPRLGNDTNRVLKVNRDRECSEWLTCSSSQTVWDEESASYRTVCNEIDLCTEYSNTGDASFCSRWNPDEPAVILDSSRYSSRDVSWYGEEYSGYAIPELYPVQYLTQVNVAPPGTCESGVDRLNESTILADRLGDVCTSDADCLKGSCLLNTEKDYRLAFVAGECSDSADFGSGCTIGYCADSGAACSANSDCLNSICVTGACVNAAGDTTGTLCGLNYSCPTGSTCNVSVATKQGSCFYGKCALSTEGKPLNDETAEEATCRAYPEIDSPFGNEVVEKWIDADKLLDESNTNPTPSASMGVRSLPYDTRSGFENANLCAPGEDCICTYKKISTSIDVKTYISVETELKEIASDPLLGDDVGGRLGICSGGDADGAFCIVDDDCNGVTDGSTVDVALGKCYPIVREDTIVGLDGFCLERDSGININGDPNTGACLTWFPVDQLEGSTDLFAKYMEAGYFATGTEYCAYVTPYVNIKPSLAVASDTSIDWDDGSADIACSENKGGGDAFAQCVTNNQYLHCPPGHYAIVGGFVPNNANDDQKKSFARFCDKNTAGDKDCPFVCVPVGAVTTEGESCYDAYVKNSGIDDDSTSKTWTENGYTWDTPIYFYKNNNLNEFDDTALAVQNCEAQGVEVNLDLENGSTFTAGMDLEHLENYSTTGWRNYKQGQYADYFIGCKETVKVDDGTNNSVVAFTDRLRNPTSSYTLPDRPLSGIIGPTNYGFEAGFNYSSSTVVAPFGKALSSTQINSEADPSPSEVLACEGEVPNVTGHRIASIPPSEFNSCADNADAFGSLTTEATDLPPEARSFAYWFFEADRSDSGEQDYTWDGYGVFDTVIVVETGIAHPVANLFAKASGGLQFLDGILSGSSYSSTIDSSGSMTTDIASSSGGDALSWDRRDIGNPPTVWAIDAQKCYGTYCQEGEENELTLNSQNGGDLESVGGFFRATLQFFAAADKNQLPIRRIIVDWGDGKQDGSESADNYYKNHRGLEDDSQTQSICARCDDGGSDCEWGMTADSCDPNYFTYQHNYRCTKSDLINLPLCGEVTLASGDYSEACTDRTACYYQPKVHVRDNWGWCTGTCTRYVGDDCFDRYGTLEGSNFASECQYSRSVPVEDDNPWVYYSGVVRVEP